MVVWGFIAGYIVIFIKKTKKLEQELDILKKKIENKE